jgi:hypothetical protein
MILGSPLPILPFTALNPVNTSPNIALSNGYLTATQTGSSVQATSCSVTSHSSGKFFASAHMDHVVTLDFAAFGIKSPSSGTGNALGGADNASVGFYNGDATVYVNNASIGTIATYAQGDTVDMAVDFDHSTIWYRINGGNWNNSGTANPATNTGGFSFSAIVASAPFCAALLLFNAPDAWTINFGGGAYPFAPPAGFSNW